jgi:hypothetical protein
MAPSPAAALISLRGTTAHAKSKVSVSGAVDHLEVSDRAAWCNASFGDFIVGSAS